MDYTHLNTYIPSAVLVELTTGILFPDTAVFSKEKWERIIKLEHGIPH